MKTNHTLPISRAGKVYYGPKTYAQAISAIEKGDADPAILADMLSNAGYPHIAAKIRKSYKPRL